MFTHVPHPEHPGWSVCGQTIGHDPAPGPRGVCMSCTPGTEPVRVPRRTDAPWCRTCGMTWPHHWDGCERTG